MILFFFVVVVSILFIIFILLFVVDKGFEMLFLGYFVVIVGVSDIFGNIVFIFISDNKKV